MGANHRSKVLPWIAAGAAVALLTAWLVMHSGSERTPPDGAVREAKSAAPLGDAPPSRLSPGTAIAIGLDAGVPPEPGSDTPPATQAPGKHPVDLARLRERLPDNLYWELGVPTKDPRVLQQRAEEGQRWNELYGKVLSNTASEEEIHRYYDHRRRVSEDFIAFASLVLQEYGPQLPEQERGLYELSIQMHRTRLAELPRQREDALSRKSTQDQRRQEWLGNEQGH